MQTLLNLLSGVVKVVYNITTTQYHVMNGSVTAKVFPTYDQAASYAHGLVSYIERHEDLEEL